jgi:LPS-assembly protein
VVTADEAFAEDEARTVLRGNVVVQRDDTVLQGQLAEYDQVRDQLFLEGEVVYRSGGSVILGDSAQMQLGEERGEIVNARFLFPEIHGLGSADSLSIADPAHVSLKGIRYTTCPPEKEDWLLRASELSLDRESNTGEAYHAVLTFMNVPFLYSPYLNFPLEGRKTGLLPPTVGTSEKNGTDISLPFYWNIAPNQDATLTARNLTARGGMLMSEYRFLTEDTKGQLNGDYLKDDKIYGDDRSYFAGSHSARLSEGWRSELLYQEVSDALYFDDLGASQAASSQTHLERRARLSYRDQYWNFLGQVQDYQTLDGSEPYQRLPQLSLTGVSPRRSNRPQLSLESEAVAFRHDSKIPTGNRLDLKPSLSLPLEGAAWFFTPKAAWRYTEYQLEDYSLGEHYIRSMPISSLDTGLFFERELAVADTPYIQTLEPRLFYLNVPYRGQNEIPLFDTSLNDFSFSQMFRDNRFSGADRQGDAHQLTAALTTRFIDDASGKERFRAAIGQIHYYQDRRVTLRQNGATETRTTSNMVGELGFRPSDALTLGITDEWDPEQQITERLSARLRYAPNERQVLGMSYRYDRSKLQRQADALMLWPLAPQWRLLGRWNYDLENEKSLDTIGGIEYESCCWTVRLIARAARNTIEDELDHAYFVTLELKGLATLGRSLEDEVGRDILGIE